MINAFGACWFVIIIISVGVLSFDYTSNTILQRTFKYTMDIKLKLCKDEGNQKCSPGKRAYFFPAFIDKVREKPSIRWVGMPCTSSEESTFGTVNDDEEIDGEFSCTINSTNIDDNKFHGIFYNSHCLQSLHPRCHPQPNAILMNVEKGVKRIKFLAFNADIKYIDQRTGKVKKYSLEGKYDPSTVGGVAQFTSDENNYKVLRKITNQYMDHQDGQNMRYGPSCHYNTTKKEVVCEEYVQQTNIHKSKEYFGFYGHEQGDENIIEINYGIEKHKIGYDTHKSTFKIALKYNKYDDKPLYGEVFFVTLNDNNENTFKMFGGIIKFDRSNLDVVIETRKIHYLSSRCKILVNSIVTQQEGDSNYPEECIPVASSVKITFLEDDVKVNDNKVIEIESIKVTSSVFDGKNGGTKEQTWESFYTNRKVKYYQSYTFRKGELVESLREDLLKPESTSQSDTIQFNDYTKSVEIQTHIQYEVEYNFELHEESKVLLNFYPYSSTVNPGTLKESVRWIGLPCPMDKPIRDKYKTGKGYCKIKFDNNNKIMEETKSTALYYHPKCFEVYSVNCGINPNGVFVNYQERLLESYSLSFKTLNYKITYFNLLKEAIVVFELNIVDGKNDNKITFSASSESRKPFALIKLTSNDIVQSHGDTGPQCSAYGGDELQCNLVSSYYKNIKEMGKFLNFPNFDQNQEENVNFDKKKITNSDYASKADTKYLITMELEQKISDQCKVYGEFYVQRENKKKEASFVMFLGLVNLNDFKSNIIEIKATTNEVESYSSQCTNYLTFYDNDVDPSYPEECIPYGDSLIGTFLKTTVGCNKNIIITQMTISSIIYDPRVKRNSEKKWNVKFDKKQLDFKKSYKFTTDNGKGVIVETEKKGDLTLPSMEKYIDYTSNSYLQKGLGYKLSINGELLANKINTRLNFYPAFSRDSDNSGKYLTWIGKPCSAKEKTDFSTRGDMEHTDNIKFKFECEIKEDFKKTKKREIFNGIFYEATCLDKLHKDCWFDNFEVFFNTEDAYDNSGSLFFFEFIVKLTIFDFHSGQVKIYDIGHKKWEPEDRLFINHESSKVHVLRRYTPDGFVLSETTSELKCKYSNDMNRPYCDSQENISKQNALKMILFKNLMISQDEIKISGYNKKLDTPVDDHETLYELTLEFDKIPQLKCDILLEIFTVTSNKEGRITLQLFGGINEFKQGEFINSKKSLYFKSKYIHTINETCNVISPSEDGCKPKIDGVKLTFMIKNSNNEKCNQFSLKYLKVISSFKNDINDVAYTNVEKEIIFSKYEVLNYTETYLIYKSDKGTSVCLKVERPWNDYDPKEYLVDPNDPKFLRPPNTCGNYTTYIVMLFLFVALGVFETATLGYIFLKYFRLRKLLSSGFKKCIEGEILKPKSVKSTFKSGLKKSAKSIKDGENSKPDINKNVQDGKVVNEEESEPEDQGEKGKDHDQGEGEAEEEEVEDHDKENGDHDGGDDDEGEDGMKGSKGKGKGGLGKKAINGKKMAGAKGAKKVGKKAAGGPKKKALGGKKTASKAKGSKVAGGKKGSPKKTAAPKRKPPRPKPPAAPKGKRK
uniref:6-cysteine protein n=1 Tax=Parastrongyloides trichosuri TaxID=131310 RepID=A0A0N4ZL72_PARTI